VNDCHSMVQDRRGRIILLTNEVRNNVVVYDKAGKLLAKWGHDFPGAHGMTLINENGDEFLYLTDYARHQVYKMTIDGKLIFTLNAPYESGKYQSGDQYKPTHVVVAPAGDFYVLDGYGQSYVLHYSHKGELLNIFGGKGKLAENLNEAHGGIIDFRAPGKPLLWVTSRQDNSFKRYTLAGKLDSIVAMPNALPCNITFHGEFGFIPQLRMKDGKSHGFVSIIDGKDQIVSNLGAMPAAYDPSGKLQPLQQDSPVFIHPHGLLKDDENSLYVCQWASGRTYPLKFVPA
jgi:peptidylamidoglycolate lyase